MALLLTRDPGQADNAEMREAATGDQFGVSGFFFHAFSGHFDQQRGCSSPWPVFHHRLTVRTSAEAFSSQQLPAERFTQ